MEFTISGRIIGGNKIGRTLGFPTANISIVGRKEIVNGVYGATITIGQSEFSAIANIGVRPTIGDIGTRLLEVYIFDFEGDIYNTEVSVKLRRFLRPEQKFASLEELRAQIAKDIEAARDCDAVSNAQKLLNIT